ncbi:unnamed protein product [Moneuplotes crassus]|uniref:Uncharacterized protein n=1 Tax=Euplotes crassus TaxID=5936 RepID=A0AAD1XTI8_EUPCR|nr:unnamed protein product [Moneuplotes crassus]
MESAGGDYEGVQSTDVEMENEDTKPGLCILSCYSSVKNQRRNKECIELLKQKAAERGSLIDFLELKASNLDKRRLELQIQKNHLIRDMERASIDKMKNRLVIKLKRLQLNEKESKFDSLTKEIYQIRDCMLEAETEGSIYDCHYE